MHIYFSCQLTESNHYVAGSRHDICEKNSSFVVKQQSLTHYLLFQLYNSPTSVSGRVIWRFSVWVLYIDSTTTKTWTGIKEVNLDRTKRDTENIISTC